MSILDGFIACSGSWNGTNRLHDPMTHLPEDSTATAIVTPILANRFVRIDYTWSYQGNPQEGSLLIGYDAPTNVVSVYWIDTWHMDNKVMTCSGTMNQNGEISVHGSYLVPNGPDWGWRIAILPKADQGLNMTMFNIPPNVGEQLAVEAAYTQKKKNK